VGIQVSGQPAPAGSFIPDDRNLRSEFVIWFVLVVVNISFFWDVTQWRLVELQVGFEINSFLNFCCNWSLSLYISLPHCTALYSRRKSNVYPYILLRYVKLYFRYCGPAFLPDVILILCTRKRSWLRHYAIRHKATVSLPNEVIGFSEIDSSCNINLYQEFSWSKGRSVNKADNLSAICEPIVQKMWEPQHLSTQRVSTACYSDSFAFLTLCLRIDSFL
jgi:hypothetical protein